MRLQTSKAKKEKTLIRKCHQCGQVIESAVESQKCVKCGKSFLPLNYFAKIHDDENYNYDDLFAQSHDIYEEDLIKGIYVLW